MGRKHRDDTGFLRKWGISAPDLALVEGTTIDAIHMRVYKFGTPFQRRKKPSKFEIDWGKTNCQLALELGLHPITVSERIQKYGTPYCDHMLSTRGGATKGRVSATTPWWELSNYKRNLLPTYFTLQYALDKLEEIKAQAPQV